jgi:uncharacterized protein YkwD
MRLNSFHGSLVIFAWAILALSWGGLEVPLLGEAKLAPQSATQLRLESDTFTLINAYRKANGLAPFLWEARIAEMARGHSRDMAVGSVDFGHGGFGSRMHDLRKTLTGMHGGGENVLMTDDTEDLADNAVALWLKSPPHLHNIRGDYNYAGLGVWENNGEFYFTEIFVKLVPLSHEQAILSPRPTLPFL